MTIGRIPSVEGGIQPTIVDAKGDLIAATAADTVNRLAVGSNDQVLVADSAASTGLAWKSYGAQFVAGKNKIINGDFGVWQRGTSFTNTNYFYTADRWITYGYATNSTTVTRQSFTVGSAPVAGYESQYFLRINSSNSQTWIAQRIEDVRTLANQTVTISFWAKASTGTPVLGVRWYQDFGSGGSTGVATDSSNITLSTSWTRYSRTITVPSISGKTLGTSNFIEMTLFSTTINFDLDIWGVQVEAGSVATPFTTATGTIQGELAACQRYYVRMGANSGGTAETYSNYGSGYSVDASNITAFTALPVQMRVRPTAIEYANLAIQDFAAAVIAVSALTLNTSQSSFTVGTVNGTVSGSTAARGCKLLNNNNNAGYLAFSAEL